MSLILPQETFTLNHVIQQLMDLITNHPYFDKEVFLRELIFNASDALGKLRYKALYAYPLDKAPNLDMSLYIRIIPDKTRKTLTILDTGIGMTKQELIHRLGSYVKPGAQAFIDALKSGSHTLTMTQFGVGFYSAFLVADKVTVISKSDEEANQYRWESTGGDTYTVSSDASNPDQLGRGTKIVLHLKEDSLEFLEEKRLKEVVSKHSECVNFPVEVETWEQLNKAKPIWTKRPEAITRKEYSRFYKSLTNDRQGFLAFKHFVAEGKLEFAAVIFIPKKAPSNPFAPKKSVRLYVRRVFMMDDCEELIPRYLSFVRGVVDSEDLPFNVPFEVMRKSKILKLMRHSIVKKILELIEEISQNPGLYKEFYKQFSEDIKFGVYDDSENREKLCEFLRFYTSNSGDEQISLKDYVSRMKEGQEYIYYLTGISKSDVSHSPFLEDLKNKGYEVIYMINPFDVFVAQKVKEYGGKKLQDCAQSETGFAIRKEEGGFTVRRDETNRNPRQSEEKPVSESEVQEPTAV